MAPFSVIYNDGLIHQRLDEGLRMIVEQQHCSSIPWGETWEEKKPSPMSEAPLTDFSVLMRRVGSYDRKESLTRFTNKYTAHNEYTHTHLHIHMYECTYIDRHMHT